MHVVRPTRIVDKNGKTTTVYRRDEAPSKSSSLAAQAPKLSAADRKAQEWRDRPMFAYMVKGSQLSKEAHPDLKEILGEASVEGSYYTLAAGTTQAELSEMLAVASPPTVLRVSGARGVRSADELVNFLESNGLSHLIEDNAEAIEEIESRGADAGALLESMDRGLSVAEAQCSWADLAEVVASRTLTETPIPENVWSGSVSWDFIKEAGTSNFRQYYAEIMPELDELSAPDIKRAVAIVKSGSNVVPGRKYNATKRDDMLAIVYAMVRIDTDSALSMRVPGLVRALNEKALMTDMSPEQRAATSLYVDEFVHQLRTSGAQIGKLEATPDRSRLGSYPKSQVQYGTPTEYSPPLKEVVEFFKNGVRVDDAIAYMERGINAEKARGLIDDGIHNSLTDGWL